MCSDASVKARTWKGCPKTRGESKKEFSCYDAVIPGHVTAEFGRWGGKASKIWGKEAECIVRVMVLKQERAHDS